MSSKKPLPFPSVGRCKPCFGTFDLEKIAAAELPLFDTFATEQGAAIGGTAIEFFVRLISRSRRDPLYGEPTRTVWKGPYEMKAFVTKPEEDHSNQEAGFRITWDAQLTLPRMEVEQAGMRGPRDGDVVRLWNVPFWNHEAVAHLEVPGGGFYFDVEKVDTDGHVNDSANFVNFLMTLRRATNFTPERRITPP